MADIFIIVILIAVCSYGLYSYIRKLRHGGGCCGEHDAPEKKVKVADRDKSHYPYVCCLTIDGMTCANCVRRVENALNRMEGTWAKVDLGTRQARVYLKRPPDETALRQTVREAGYTVLSIRQGSD